MRFAHRKGHLNGYQPGSVGKLAVITGFFCELDNVYPGSHEEKIELLKSKVVKAGPWAIPNQHKVPFFDTTSHKYFKRKLVAKDTFTLFEWTDHMMSVSSNGAASVCWREAILMRVFAQDYPALTDEQANEYFKNTPRKEVGEIAMSVVNDPLRDLGISDKEWRLGSLFTGGGKYRAPGFGGSRGSPIGLLKFLIAVERGKIVDPKSSLEIKRLMYLTDRRIRYAKSSKLKDAAVYFKSGSLYGCRPEEGYNCGKYRGNRVNYMNSVAIVEHGDSLTYMISLMSNVLRKNSAWDHMNLATRVDRIVRE